MSEKLIIFSAPSGSGKTTVIKSLLAEGLPLVFSISATSRAKREGEIEGKDYYFLTPEDFKQKIENDEFLEYEEVYPNQFYGTLKSEIYRIWQTGTHVIFDVDVIGGLNIKKKFPEHSLLIFLKPPSIGVLYQRLIARGTETEESALKRIKKAEREMQYAEKFDLVIVNDRLEDTKKEVLKKVRAFIGKK